MVYRNKTGHVFEVRMAPARTPDEADYWGFFFEVEGGRGRFYGLYNAWVMKQLCQTSNEAQVFLLDEPFSFLKDVLDKYVDDGRPPEIHYELKRGWVVF